MEFTVFGRMFFFQVRGVREVPKILLIFFVSKNTTRVVRSSLVILAVYGCRFNVVQFGRNKLILGRSTKQCVGEIMNGGEEGISP